MNRRHFLVATSLVSLLTLPACGSIFGKNFPTYRYRLTVEVDTPQGLRVGSSVIEVMTGEDSRKSLSLGNVHHNIHGEAVAVDLPGGRTLFALLRSEDSVDWATNIVFRLTPTETRPDKKDGFDATFAATFEKMRANRGLQQIPHFKPVENQWQKADAPERNLWPMLVTFTDIRDPKSVEKVDPDHLDTTFGKGVTLKRITVQVTDDSVTSGIEKRLGWLRKYARRDARLNGSTSIAISTNEISDNLGAGEFSTEILK
jgi:hypothetical protein